MRGIRGRRKGMGCKHPRTDAAAVAVVVVAVAATAAVAAAVAAVAAVARRE